MEPGRPGYRLTIMDTTRSLPRRPSTLRTARALRRTGAVVAASLVLTLGACGSEDAPADDDAGTSQVPDTTHRDLGTFQGTGMGVVAERTPPIEMADAAAVDAWGEEIGMPDDVVAEMVAAAESAEVGDGEAMVGAVLHSGCEVVSDYQVEVIGGVTEVVPMVPSSDVQCLAPTTSVALLVLDADLLKHVG